MAKRKMTVMMAGVLLVAPLWFTSAHAEWSGEITPYIWAMGIDGDVTIRGNDVDVDVGFNDVLDNLDFGGSILGELQRDRWVLWGQLDYMDLNTGRVDTRSSRLSAELDTSSVIWTLAAGYRFDGWKQGQHFDVLVGARQLSLDNDLTIRRDGILRDRTETFSRDEDYTDAVVVVRPSLPITERWRFNPTLSYGSGDSESTWEIWPQFQYQVSDSWAARIGYRRLHYDIEVDGDNEFDAAFQGWALGFGWIF